jgi:hypothetical protein
MEAQLAPFDEALPRARDRPPRPPPAPCAPPPAHAGREVCAQILRIVTENAAAERAVSLSRAHAVRAPPAPLPRRRCTETSVKSSAAPSRPARPLIARPGQIMATLNPALDPEAVDAFFAAHVAAQAPPPAPPPQHST